MTQVPLKLKLKLVAQLSLSRDINNTKSHLRILKSIKLASVNTSGRNWSKLNLTFLTLLFGVRLVEHLHTIQQLGCASFASWKNTTSWMIQMGQASTRGVNFFATVTTNILNYSKILISIFQITNYTRSTIGILSTVNCSLQLFSFRYYLFIYVSIHSLFCFKTSICWWVTNVTKQRGIAKSGSLDRRCCKTAPNGRIDFKLSMEGSFGR